MNSLKSGGKAVRKACGSTMRNIVCVRLDYRAVDFYEGVSARKVDSALIVNLDYLYKHLISYVYDVLDLIHALDVKL